MNRYKNTFSRTIPRICLFALLALANITVFGQAAPSSTNLLLWLAADKAVDTNANGVYEWDDQSGSPNPHDALSFVGNAQVGQIAFSNGVHAVVSFNGTAMLNLESFADFFAMTNYTVYVVGDVDNTIVSSDWIGSWPGFVVGISDTVPGRIKFGTQNTAGLYQDLEPASGADLANRVPYLITASFVNNGVKSLYVDGALVGTQVLSGSIGWAGSGVGIGALNFSGSAAQYLVGDIAEILVYSSVDPVQQAAAELYLNVKYFLTPGPVTITAQPQDLQVTEHTSASFQVAVNGTAPFIYQWYKNSSPIQGASTSIYGITSATPDDAATYSVAVSNIFSGVSYYVQSSNAVLTVIVPSNSPVVTSALVNYTNNTMVTVTFSELVNPQTAANAANYSINNGVSVMDVTAVADATNTSYINSEVLTTSPITAQSVLTVNQVQDQYGNTIPANSQVVIVVPGPVSPPPSTDRLLWLEADTGVIAANNVVSQWNDQSGAANQHNAIYSFGNAQLGQLDFINAIHPVVGFDGTAGLTVTNSADFDLQNFTIYIVGNAYSTNESDDFVGNWPGFVLGGSDVTAGALKWGTWGTNSGGDFYQAIEPSPLLNNGVPTIIEGAFANPGNQTLYFNGLQVDILSNTSPIDYSTAEGLSIGTLFPSGGQNLIGDIAEILIYSNVSAAQDAAVQTYLYSKYFEQGAPVTITAQPQSLEVTEHDSAVFQVSVQGTLPFTYQWYKNSSPIQGASTSSYGIASATPGDAAAYSVTVSNIFNGVSYYVESSNAVLTVFVPTNSPVVTSALINYTNNTMVTVTFSELVNPQTAATAANYGINNGVSVMDVTALADATNANYVTSVVLTTSPITAQSVLTVNQVQDQYGNTIPANSRVVIVVPGPAGAPPSTNLLWWMEADKGVKANTNGVYEWDDQSGYPIEQNAIADLGSPQVRQVAFPNASHPAVSFDGSGALQVDNTADFNLQDFTIYLVGDIANTKFSEAFLGNWSGWVLGVSDSTIGELKWGTWGTNAGGDFYQADTSENSSPVLGNLVPTLIEGAFANPGNQTLTVNGAQANIITNTSPIDYSGASGMTMGNLFPTYIIQSLVGDIEEILIYTNVSPAQDTAVQNYLVKKYFTPSLIVPTLLSATRDPQIQTSVTVAFSEPVGATATNALNYTINNGVTVSAAVLINPTNVVLITSPIATGQSYLLTVNGVGDWAGNASTTSSQVPIVIPNLALNIVFQAGQVILTWNNALATLQSASALTGPWSNVTGASSPYTLAPTLLQQYYRLSQ